MSLSDSDVAHVYLANGAIVNFSIVHKIIQDDSDEIEVYLVDESTTPATETLQTEGVHYTLTGASPPTTPFNDTVHFLSAPAANLKVLIRRKMDLTQPTDFAENAGFPAETTETTLDRIVAEIQKVDEKVGRALKLRKSSILVDVPFPDPQASTLLAWNDDATAVENGPLVSDIEAAVTASTDAAASALAAAGSASAAASSATNAAASATSASTQASNAATSATSAGTSATNAASSASAASSSASVAAGHASAAATSETNAASSASAASSSASSASTSATNAANSATSASGSASSASTSATNAASSATAAAGSATSAANSASAAAASASAAAASVGAVDTVATATNATFYPLFVASSTNSQQTPNLDASGITYNPSTNALTTTTFVGALTGTASGNTTYTPNQFGVVLSGSTNVMSVLAPDASTTKVLTSGGTGANPSWAELPPSSGSKNYLTTYNSNTGNGDFELNATTGWSLFNTTLTSGIPTGAITAGAASITTFATIGSGSQLSKNYSLNTASSGAWAAGAGFISSAFTIDKSDQAKVLSFSAEYSAIANASNGNFSGTSSNTFAVYIYDVTNSVWIQPSGVYGITQTSGVGRVIGSFQSSSNGTQYRIAVLAVNASSGAITMYWDTFTVGPTVLVQGTPMTDPVAYTPTFTGLGTVSTFDFWQSREGPYLKIVGSWTNGTVTATEMRISLPSGLTAATFTGIKVAGSMRNSNTATSGECGVLIESGVTYMTFNRHNGVSGLAKSNGNDFNNGETNAIIVMIPIAGWSSNVQMSESSDTRVVAALITGDPASATSGNPIIVPTVSVDTHAGYNATTGRYTVQIPGIYKIYGALQSASSATTLTIYKNAVSTSLAGNLDSNGEATFCSAVNCVAGDIIDLRPGGTVDATNMTLNIERLSGPTVIAASESIAAKYTSSTTSIGSSTTVSQPTKDYDTHGAYSAGTFTCPAPGIYNVIHNVFFSGTVTITSAQRIYAAIAVNGTEKITMNFFSNVGITGGSLQLGGSGDVKCNAGDTITVIMHNNGTAAALDGTASGNSTSFRRVA